MFSKISRYRKLPDVVAVDAQGRRLESKGLRLLPELTGTFLHTVEAGDRLDHSPTSITSSPENGGGSATPAKNSHHPKASWERSLLSPRDFP